SSFDTQVARVDDRDPKRRRLIAQISGPRLHSLTGERDLSPTREPPASHRRRTVEKHDGGVYSAHYGRDIVEERGPGLTLKQPDDSIIVGSEFLHPAPGRVGLPPLRAAGSLH